jgi:hypothetical protein
MKIMRKNENLNLMTIFLQKSQYFFPIFKFIKSLFVKESIFNLCKKGFFKFIFDCIKSYQIL